MCFWVSNMNDKLRVLDRWSIVDLEDLFHGNSVEQVSAKLWALESTIDYGKGEDAEFEVDSYDPIEVFLYVFRDETDAEYQERKMREEKAQEKARKSRETKAAKARAILMAAEEQERADFERLKAKYGESK